MTNPYMERRKGVKGKMAPGKAAEKKVTKRLGGKQTRASGADPGDKGDVVLRDYLVEVKSTTKGTMKLDLGWLRKITMEAIAKGKTPALNVQFITSDGRPWRDGSWVMVPEDVFKEIADEGRS